MDLVSPLKGVVISDVDQKTTPSPPKTAMAGGELNEFNKILDAERTPKSDENPSSKFTPDVTKQFEVMVLSQLIGEVFKEQSDGAFGKGMQGDFYTSIFTDAVAEKLAEGDGFGIAKLL